MGPAISDYPSGYKTSEVLTTPLIRCSPIETVSMALHEVGLLVYSQGFAISRDEYIIRELAFCDWTGHHHVLFKYLLPKGVSYNQLSEEAKTRVDRQTKTVHGLPFEPYTAYNRHEFHPYHQIQDDIIRWCQQHLTPQWGRLGVFTLNGLYRLFQEPQFSYPLVVLEGQGCRDLAPLPTATVNVLATNDQSRNWCVDHSDGVRGSGVWHDHCAHVRACQMSGWLRRQTNVLPTLFQVNAQRVLWQQRCDRLLDYLLCNYCKDEKDDAFARGQGLDWIPDNCNECSTVRRIFEQTVTCREWQTPRLYADDEPQPCGLGHLCLTINTVFNCFFTDHAHLHRRCQRRGHACGAIMSLVWSYVCGLYPTLSPSIQVPRALDPVRVGCRHLDGHPGGVSIGSTNPSSHQPPVYTTQL